MGDDEESTPALSDRDGENGYDDDDNGSSKKVEDDDGSAAPADDANGTPKEEDEETPGEDVLDDDEGRRRRTVRRQRRRRTSDRPGRASEDSGEESAATGVLRSAPRTTTPRANANNATTVRTMTRSISVCSSPLTLPHPGIFLSSSSSIPRVQAQAAAQQTTN